MKGVPCIMAFISQRGQTTPDDVDTLVQHGEAYGFHSVMIADHIVFPTDIQSRYRIP